MSAKRIADTPLQTELGKKRKKGFVRWKDIIATQDNTFHVPNCLLRILRDYLRNRSLLYETLGGQGRMEVISGVVQGSILGPDLWNATYDSLLKLVMPKESHLVDYADEVTAKVHKWGDLRVSAYRTVSDPAVMVIAGVDPVALLAKERQTISLIRKQGEIDYFLT